MKSEEIILKFLLLFMQLYCIRVHNSHQYPSSMTNSYHKGI
uniref:Uncharacterized protein n=1 Tax=Rhizophora mucronata TaxID=61149 RepID=A0A2P2QK90_RHIMU